MAALAVGLAAVSGAFLAAAQSQGQPAATPVPPTLETAEPFPEVPLRAAIGGFVSVNNTRGESGGLLLVSDLMVMGPRWRRFQPGLGFQLTTDRRRYAMAFDIVLRAKASAASRWYTQAMAGVGLGVVNREEPVGRNDVFVSLERGRDEGLALAVAWELPVYGDGEGSPSRTGRPEWFVGAKCGGYAGLLSLLNFAAAVGLGFVHGLANGD